MRLRLRREFSRVYAARAAKSAGPLRVYAAPNHENELRLGMSIARRVGIAVRRHRIRRLLREAFRLSRHQWPTGYDVVVVVKPHEPASLAEYQRLLGEAIRSLHEQWQDRRWPQ